MDPQGLVDLLARVREQGAGRVAFVVGARLVLAEFRQSSQGQGGREDIESVQCRHCSLGADLADAFPHWSFST